MNSAFKSRCIIGATWLLLNLLGPDDKALGQESEWQWKECRNWLAILDRGGVETVLYEVQEYLVENPTHGESLFTLAVAHSRLGQPELAVAAMERAVAAGLPAERFLAGPQTWLEGVQSHAAYREFLNRHAVKPLLHGPLLGDVTERSAKVWIRYAQSSEVRVEWRKRGDESFQQSVSAMTTQQNDRTLVLEIKGLQPFTDYEYRLTGDGEPISNLHRFKTAPSTQMKARFKVAFGGGAAYQPRFERMWSTIQSRQPQALLLLGDNVYIDYPKQFEVQRYCYYRRQSQPLFRALTAEVPVYAIWDDHDFIDNDGWGGPLIDEPAWKRQVWSIFQQNWNNPYYGGGSSHPGCYFHFQIGPVDFIMLDGRYYREDPKQDQPSMLGPRQMEWLKQRLLQSQGVFKVLCSPVPWAPGAKPGSLDTWDGYEAEREQIFQWIRDHRIPGVVLMSADRHRSDLWRLEKAAGYDLYEFESSRLTNLHRHGPVAGSLFSYNEKCSFGLLEFDTHPEDATLTYRVITIDNEEVFEFELKRSQLQ